MVWLKIRKHDIDTEWMVELDAVVVWLKIRKHDIEKVLEKYLVSVVVWLKIRKHDISFSCSYDAVALWFD